MIALDIALSLAQPIQLGETARLLRDGLLLTSAALPQALDHFVPADAQVTRAEIHITAPNTMGDTTARDNDLQQRVDLSSLGEPSRPLNHSIGYAAGISDSLTETEAAELVAGGFERMSLANGYTDPRIAIRALRAELGLPS